MKIAYLIQVHRNPRLLKRLVIQLASDDAGIFVHVDRKVDARPFQEGCLAPNVRFLPPEKRLSVTWGEFSQVEATLRLMDEALSSPTSYGYFVFLQGSDYPIRSAKYIQRFLAASAGDEFISLVRMPAPGFPLAKINKIRYPSSQRILRFFSRAFAKLGLAYRDYSELLGVPNAYAGDACWTLSRTACSLILHETTTNPIWLRYFRKTFTSDEMFFHTIIGNSPLAPRVRRNLMYRDWVKSGDHPELLRLEHVERFERAERFIVTDQFGSGEALFARKFCDEDLYLIDRIDQMIARKGDSL